MRRVIAIVCWTWIPFCWQPLWGQTPRIGVQAGSNQKGQSKVTTTNANDDQRGTPSAPFIVEAHGRPDSPEETAKHKAEYNAKEYRDIWTFRLAVISVIATVVLTGVGIAGAHLAIKSLNVLKAQTKATEASVAHLINSERAWVVPNVNPSEIVQVSVGAYAPYNRLFLSLTNKGKTVARITSVDAAYKLLPSGTPLPPVPEYPEIWTEAPAFEEGAVIAPGDFVSNIEIAINEWFDDAKFAKLKSGELILFVYGYSRYFDFARDARQMNFCYRYIPMDGKSSRWDAAYGIGVPRVYNTHT
jgi:hypothetical protein